MFKRRGQDPKEETSTGETIEGDEFDAGAADDEIEDETGDDEIEELAEDMTADLDSQAADYFADNDIWMYGPNAAAVVEILDWLEEITPAEARPLSEAWLAIPKSDRDRARKAARKLAETDTEIERHLQLAREAATTWMSVAVAFPDFIAADSEWPKLAGQAAEAALDAATAVILEGKLEEAHYEALLEPWSETTAELDAAAEAAAVESGDEDENEGGDEEGEDAEGEFGPNSNSVIDFMNRLWLLTPEQVGRLVGAWKTAPREELKTAHEAIQELAEENADCREQVRAAQDKLAPWLNSGRVAETAGILGQTGSGESRKMAGPALADAIAALVLGDLLDPADAEALYAPWYNLMGAPELPEPLPVEKPKPTTPAKVAKSAAPKSAALQKDAPKSSKPVKKK
jgi:uncharacterized membrane protein